MTEPMAAAKKPLVNLMRGWPAPDLLPSKLIAGACQRLLVDPAKYVPVLQYGGDEGYQPLRKQLAEWLSRRYGVVEADARRVCITGGASQNLACILQSFSDPNYTRAVWMVAPTYHLAANMFADAGFAGRMRAVPEDDEGIDLDVFESRIRKLEDIGSQETRPFKDPSPYRKLYRHIIYAVPTCANPSGKTMSLRRREGLVELARRHDALVICDDVYDFLQWPLTTTATTRLLPRLCDIEASMSPTADDPHGFGHCVSNGSFSKMAGPGVRTGWAESTPAFVLGLSKTGSTRSGGAPSQFCAGMLAELLQAGELQSFVDSTVVPGLQRRHGLMMAALRTYLAPLGVVTYEQQQGQQQQQLAQYGGYFVWLTLTRGPSAARLGEAALKEENIRIGHGDLFAVPRDSDADADANADSDAINLFHENVRLSYSWENEENMIDAVKRLGDLIKRMQGNS